MPREGHGRRVSRRDALADVGAVLGAIAASGCVPHGPVSSGGPAVPVPTPAAGAGPTPAPGAVAGGAGASGSTGTLTILPAGRRLAGRLLFVSDANIWLLDRGQPRRLTPDRISRQPAWSRDGSMIAHVKLVATSGSDLWLMDAHGANSQGLTDNESRDDLKQEFTLRPVWLPEGDRLLYLSRENSRDTQLWQLTIATRRRQRLRAPAGDGVGGLDSPKLSPDGRVLAVTSFQPGRGPFGRPQIWTYPLAGGPPRQLTDAPDGAYDPDWSPGGQHLAYTVRSAGRHDVWVMQADGSGAHPLTAAGVCRAPAWSPDGGWIAYLSAATGTFEVWAIPAPPEASAPDAPAPAGGARQITQGGLLEATSGLAWAP